MKKLASLLLAGLMLFSFAGCSGGSDADTQPDASPEAQTDGETGAQGEFRVALVQLRPLQLDPDGRQQRRGRYRRRHLCRRL